MVGQGMDISRQMGIGGLVTEAGGEEVRESLGAEEEGGGGGR